MISFPLASLQGLPGKTGIPAIPRLPAPAPRVPQSRGWALPPGWDSSAVRCIQEGGRRGEEGKERGEGGEGNQRTVAAAAALTVFSAKVKDTPFFGRNASKSFLCTPTPIRSIRGSPGPLHQLLCGREYGAFARSRSFTAAFLTCTALGLKPKRDYGCISVVEALG